MQAVWWLVWPKLFGPGARAIVEGWTPSGHTRLLPASRLTVAPGHRMHSQQSGPQSATLLRIRALPVRATGCAYGCHLLRALRIGKMGICVHSTRWLQAHIGMKPDAASGRCVQLRLCPTRLPRGHRKITRSNTKATSDLRSKEDQQIRQSMTIRPKHGISVRSPQAPGPRSRSALAAGEGATTLGDHPFSLITCVRVSCASNAGKLEVGSHSWRSLFAPASALDLDS